MHVLASGLWIPPLSSALACEASAQQPQVPCQLPCALEWGEELLLLCFASVFFQPHFIKVFSLQQPCLVSISSFCQHCWNQSSLANPGCLHPSLKPTSKGTSFKMLNTENPDLSLLISQHPGVQLLAILPVLPHVPLPFQSSSTVSQIFRISPEH